MFSYELFAFADVIITPFIVYVNQKQIIYKEEQILFFLMFCGLIVSKIE